TVNVFQTMVIASSFGSSRRYVPPSFQISQTFPYVRTGNFPIWRFRCDRPSILCFDVWWFGTVYSGSNVLGLRQVIAFGVLLNYKIEQISGNHCFNGTEYEFAVILMKFAIYYRTFENRLMNIHSIQFVVLFDSYRQGFG